LVIWVHHARVFHLLFAFFVDDIVLSLHLLIDHLLLLDLGKLTVFVIFLIFILALALIVAFIGRTLLLLAKADISRWEVGGGQVETVVVLSRDKELALLFSQVLIWVHAGIAQDLHVALEFLNLVEIVDEGL
jgi:hypothetical protein